MNRRQFLGLAGAGVLAGAAWHYWPRQGWANPCLTGLPPALAEHELVRAAWAGINASLAWDCHVHLIGIGDAGSGAWANPQFDTPLHPLQYAQKKFYLNAGCVNPAAGHTDASYVERLRGLVAEMRPGAKLMLLAFDRNYHLDGTPDLDHSSFYTPNAYARDVARKYPDAFEWIASIHPYRKDAREVLEQAIQDGARAVKWLPSAMNIDPDTTRCDAFYDLMAEHDLPLLTHAGNERAVFGSDAQEYGNPLKLRRPLEHGVRVIVAHCASAGKDRDLDRGPNGPQRRSFDLFARMMLEARYEHRLYGDISALTQFDRAPFLQEVMAHPEWHGRLLNGTDYPLPGVLPIYTARAFVKLGMLPQTAVPVLEAVQRYNPLLFDFVLKRSITFKGARLPAQLFETRSFFERTRNVPIAH